MKRLVPLFFLYFLLPQNIFAATLSIQNTPSSVNQSDEFSVDVSLGCSGCADSYLRGVFYDSGTSYFGYTQDNSGNFSNAPGSNCTTFFKIAQSDLVSGSWSGKIKFKPDSSSAYFKGSGEYSFKVGRYTSSCSSPSVWSQEVVIDIVGPTSTPTSAPSATPNFSPTKTPTPYLSTASTLTPKTISKAVKSASTVARKDSTASGKNTSNISSPSPTVKKQSLVAGESDSNKDRLILTIVLFSGAILFIIAAGILIKKYRSEITQWINS